jgi:hypothetical protein
MLLNLSLVTKALITLIDDQVTNSPEWPAAAPLTVSPLPPDKLTGDHTLGLYLYHIIEAAYAKNAPAVAAPNAPLKFTPMGLELYYLLTAHSDLSLENATVAEQLMMGLGMKALRDMPVIDDGTVIGSGALFQSPGLNALSGRDNRFRVTLQPAAASEAVQYWTAGTHAPRLAAYYQVTTALFEPEPLTSRTGRVFSYGVHTFLRGGPRLDAARNSVTFTIPGDPTPRVVPVQPAEVPVGGDVTFLGTDLSGDETELHIQRTDWTNPIRIDPIQWGVTAIGDRIAASVQERADALEVLPGLYSAFAVVIDRRKMPDGSMRSFRRLSNQTPFAVAPRIDGIAFGAGVNARLATVSGLNFDPVKLPDDAIQAYLGSDRLTRVPAAAPAAGEFNVANRTTLRFRLPAALATGQIVPVRILAGGAESAPRWIVVP